MPHLSVIVLLAGISMGLAVWSFLAWRKHRSAASSRRKQQFADAWLNHLLPVLEGQSQVASLPVPGTPEEMSVTMQLILDLVERVRGQYRDGLCRVMDHIGAEVNVLRELRRPQPSAKITACRLLALTRADANVDLQLTRTLEDPDWNVRLEAAYALAVRQPLGLSMETLLSPLRTTPAFETEMAKKIIRQFAPLPGRGEELARALMGSRNAQERVVLLAGIADADDLTLSDVVAWQLSDYAPAVRAEAVRTLERMADPLQIAKVTALVADPDPTVRRAVAAYASSMGGSSTTHVALQTLARDISLEVRQTAEAGLRCWQTRESHLMGPEAGS
ncbi:MAG: HEAT repeat domain-containing protein [Verrucomicrobium sp.]